MSDPDAYVAVKLSERNILEDENIFPKDVVLESTSFCNLNCVMCSQEKLTRKKSVMSWPLYIKIVEEIAEKGNGSTRLWLCYYGEPLMRKDISDMVLFATQKGLSNIVINSNMNLMTPGLAEKLVTNGLTTIFVGLDACTSEVYDQIRRGGNYENVVKNILTYKNVLDSIGKHGQQIIIQFIELEQNKHQKEDMIAFWRKHGIAVKIRPSITWHNSNSLQGAIDADDGRMPCHWLMNIFPITSEGDCVYCGCDFDGRVVSGNIANSSIFEIWNTVKKVDRAKQLNHEWDRLPDFCKNCSDWRGAYAKYE